MLTCSDERKDSQASKSPYCSPAVGRTRSRFALPSPSLIYSLCKAASFRNEHFLCCRLFSGTVGRGQEISDFREAKRGSTAQRRRTAAALGHLASEEQINLNGILRQVVGTLITLKSAWMPRDGIIFPAMSIAAANQDGALARQINRRQCRAPPRQPHQRLSQRFVGSLLSLLLAYGNHRT